MSKDIEATIKVSIAGYLNNHDLTIDEICAPLEEQGWVIDQAWINQEGNS